jgi:hypothetical protein
LYQLDWPLSRAIEHYAREFLHTSIAFVYSRIPPNSLIGVTCEGKPKWATVLAEAEMLIIWGVEDLRQDARCCPLIADS